VDAASRNAILWQCKAVWGKEQLAQNKQKVEQNREKKTREQVEKKWGKINYPLEQRCLEFACLEPFVRVLQTLFEFCKPLLGGATSVGSPLLRSVGNATAAVVIVTICCTSHRAWSWRDDLPRAT
jgi:hypothetical protein